VSFLAAGLRHHSWVCEQWKLLGPPLLTCEPVLTEAAYLPEAGRPRGRSSFCLLGRGVIRIAIDIQEEQTDLRALMHRYRDRPMSLADACLVRMAEIHAGGEVFTLDSDFRVYRRHGNRVIPVLMPDPDREKAPRQLGPQGGRAASGSGLSGGKGWETDHGRRWSV